MTLEVRCLKTAVAVLFVSSFPTSALAEGPPACSWKTVDDYLSPTHNGASASAVLSTRAGTWVAGVVASDDSSPHWVVRGRARRGATFTTVDDYLYSATLRTHPDAIAQSPRGDLLVVGGANNPSNLGSWLVRRSTNGGASWATTDEFADPTVPASTARAVATSPWGEVLVGGFHNVSPAGGYHWVLRGSADRGLTFTTREDHPPTRDSSGIEGLAIDSGGTTWAAGYDYDGARWHWTVRRGTVSGGSVVVDDYLLDPSNSSMPRAVVSPAPGLVFVAGYGMDAANRAHWVVRKSANDGATWSTVDDLFAGSCAARGIGYDPHRRALYVVGRCFDGTQYRWTTRQSHDQGHSWSTEDSFVLASGFSSYANGISAGDRGPVVVGVASDGERSHWLVRERVCGGDEGDDDDDRPEAPPGAPGPCHR